jgi:hypothetical protein
LAALAVTVTVRPPSARGRADKADVVSGDDELCAVARLAWLHLRSRLALAALLACDGTRRVSYRSAGLV